MVSLKQPNLYGSFLIAYTIILVGGIVTILAAIRSSPMLLASSIPVMLSGAGLWFKARTDKSLSTTSPSGTSPPLLQPTPISAIDSSHVPI